MTRVFVPELKAIEFSQDMPLFLTTEGVQGVMYDLPVIDLESPDAVEKLSSIQSILKDLPSGDLLRIIYDAESKASVSTDDTRLALGALSQNVRISIERSTNTFDHFPKGWRKTQCSRSADLSSSLPIAALKTLEATVSSSESIEKEFELPQSEAKRLSHAIDFGHSVTGALRLWKQGSSPLTEETLAHLKDALPLPYQIIISAKKAKASVTEFKLRSQLSRQSLSTDPTSATKTAALIDNIEETNLHGASIVEMEWVLILTRDSEEELRRDLKQAQTVLKPMGEVMIETVGLPNTFRATRVGAHSHYTFKEISDKALVFLPLFSFGATAQENALKKRALLLHRQDGSLHVFDQFNSKFLAYNIVIAGKTGSGKSVLANSLTQSLLEDETIEMVKIDVGGSYTKECDFFKGQEVTFSLTKPSGVNPFRVLKGIQHSNEAIEVLSKFVCTLIREENEATIPRSLQVQIDSLLKNYAEILREAPSIDDFYNSAPEFPRKALLSRWIRGGVYENALKDANTHRWNRYRYYNFESLQSASSPEYSEGVMAAVIAATNLEMMKMAKERPSHRLVLVCDETKFFIERNASFFLLTTANFRKFGHGVILITQKIENFELETPQGKRDSGILLNSPIRFLFEQDIDREYLGKTFNLSSSHLDAITTHPYRGQEFRQCVLQDDTGTRLVRLYLSSQEYWRVTSTKEDNDKIRALTALIPGLTLTEAIKCLSAFENRLSL